MVICISGQHLLYTVYSTIDFADSTRCGDRNDPHRSSSVKWTIAGDLLLIWDQSVGSESARMASIRLVGLDLPGLMLLVPCIVL